MSADTGSVVETRDAATALHTRGELTYVPEAPGEDRVNLALGDAILGLANLDRAIRGVPPVTGPTDLHPAVVATFLKAARETALAQHPRVVLNAVQVASEELREILDHLVTDPSAAVVSDPERMKDACAGMVRLIIEKYRGAVYASLADVRKAQE